MKITFTRNSYFNILIGVVSLGSANLKAQSPTTFTATNIKVFDTLTNLNIIHAKALTTTDTLRAKDHVVLEQNLEVKGWVSIDAGLSVADTATFNGEIKAAKGFMFDANNGFKLKQFGGTNYFILGKSGYAVPIAGTCQAPVIQPWMVMNGGGFVTAQQNPPGAPSVNASLKMSTAPWNGSGYIEVEGTNEVGATDNALFLNYFCGRDIGLCVNTSLPNGGGKVSVGNFLSAQQHVEIGGQQYGIQANNAPAGNIALDMHVNFGKAIRVRTFDGNIPMFEVFNQNTSINKTTFLVNGNGKTFIGVGRPLSTGLCANAMLSVDGMILAKDLYVAVNNVNYWADYVFNKNYDLMPIKKLKEYVHRENHLPGIPTSKQIFEEGLSVPEMQKKQMEKIEELYLYIFQLKEELDNIKKESAKKKD